MASKNITLESRMNFETDEEYQKYRKREEARAFVEEMRRRQIERTMFETTVSTFYGTPRSRMPASWRKGLLCRNKNYKTKTKKNPIGRPKKTERSRIRDIHYGLLIND